MHIFYHNENKSITKPIKFNLTTAQPFAFSFRITKTTNKPINANNREYTTQKPRVLAKRNRLRAHAGRQPRQIQKSSAHAPVALNCRVISASAQCEKSANSKAQRRFRVRGNAAGYGRRRVGCLFFGFGSSDR